MVIDKDAIPHCHYNSKRLGAIYAVRVRCEITSIAQFHDVHQSYYKHTLGGGLRARGTDKYSVGTDKFSLGTDKYSLGTSHYTSSDRLSNTKVQCTSCGHIFFAFKKWSPYKALLAQKPRVDAKNCFGFLRRRALSDPYIL